MQTTQNAPIEALLEAIGNNLEKRTKQMKLNKLNLAKLADLNRNTVGAALSGSDMKLSTLIRLTRTLGYTDWIKPLIETPAPTPMEQLASRSKSSPKLYRTVRDEALTYRKPASRPMGRKKERA